MPIDLSDPVSLLRLAAAVARLLGIAYHLGWGVPALVVAWLLREVRERAGQPAGTLGDIAIEALGQAALIFASEQALWLTIQLFSNNGVDPRINLAVLVVVWLAIRLYQTVLLRRVTRSFWQLLGPVLAPVARDVWHEKTEAARQRLGGLAKRKV